ncbi:MAG: hypothetical protein IJ781_05415 [Atopobiaceae bacterium]|nr:hypothetical protein [Atopobiaceae bacterium]
MAKRITDDSLECCFYTVEEHDGKKYVHYSTDIVENGEYPDSVVEREAYEEYDSYEGTSYDIIDYTWLFLEVGAWSNKDEFDEQFSKESTLVQQYMSRVYDTEADKYIKDMLKQSDQTELKVWEVNKSTPCGLYWC